MIEFELKFIDDATKGPFFQITLTNAQQNLLMHYPPDGQIKLIIYINDVEKDSIIKPQSSNECTKYSKKIFGSMNTSFVINISKIISKPMELQYVISMDYGKCNLISKMKTISISERIIEACESMGNIIQRTNNV